MYTQGYIDGHKFAHEVDIANFTRAQIVSVMEAMSQARSANTAPAMDDYQGGFYNGILNCGTMWIYQSTEQVWKELHEMYGELD